MTDEEKAAAQEVIVRGVFDNMCVRLMALRDLDEHDDELLHQYAETVGLILFMDSTMRHGVFLSEMGQATYRSACAKRDEIMDELGFEGGPYAPRLNG